MKFTNFILLLILSSNLTSFAQTKILFDATKAETASNADWVIDADNFNIGYGPNAYIGGNEANPQQIPTPAQSGITSSTSQNYWKGALSAWGVDAVKLGYQVETLPYNGQITYGDSNNSQDLSNYKVFVVCEPNLSFSNSEKTAIMNFVQNGGGLFMISDHDNSDRNSSGMDSPHIWNDFMQNNTVQNNPFGISFDYEFFDENSNNIPNLSNDPLLHGSYGDVTGVEYHGATSMTINTSQNSSVKAVAYRSGYSNSASTGVLCAYTNYGSGKVVAISDSSPADDGTGDDNDNLYDGWIQDANGNHERLIMNATIWLATDNTASATSFHQDNQVSVSVLQNQLLIKSNLHTVYNLKVANITGQIIYKKPVETNREITLPIRKTGIYFYQLFDSQDVAVKSGKLVVSFFK